jgi:NitT/TauT family transport system substrate-binding protein
MAARDTSSQPLQMILNTFVSGPQAWFFVAHDRGYLAEEGLTIEFTPGDTAANAVPKVALGQYDVGYGDLNALIERAARFGQQDAVAVYATFTASPYTLAVPMDSPVHSPRDLQGCTIGSHPNDAAMLMWPEFAATVGLAVDAIEVEICTDPHSRMVPDLVRSRRWDGMFGFVNTLRAAAIEAGLDPERSMRFIEYRDAVPDLYGAALIVRRSLAEQRPDAVRGLVRAVNRAVADTLADPEAAMQAVLRRDTSLDKAANLLRLTGTIELDMAGADPCVGWVDADRLARAALLIARVKALPRIPQAAELFDPGFLPPMAERIRIPPRDPSNHSAHQRSP